MTESTKISVRMGDKELEQLDALAKNHGLNRTAAVNLLVKFAVQFLQQSEFNAMRATRSYLTKATSLRVIEVNNL